MQLYESIQALYDFAERPIKRIGTGFKAVDELIGGPAPGEVAMVLGRSYAGKSLIGQNIIVSNATVPSVFFSLEMPAAQAVMRMYSLWTDEPANNIQRAAEAGRLPNDVYDMAFAFPHHEICDEPGMSLFDMSEYIGKYEARHKLRPEFIVIDYLELLGGAKGNGEGLLATESQITNLKDWAKREQMRVFVLHQTNRKEPKWLPPTADSARWGGYTESDFVIGLWRPEWDPALTWKEKAAMNNLVCLNVLKNRAYGIDAEEIRYRLQPSLRLEFDGGTYGNGPDGRGPAVIDAAL